MKRIQELDCLRGIAAFVVLLFHYTAKFRSEFGHTFSEVFDVRFGHYGVQLFFIISGFVIFLTIERSEKASDFVVKRFSRLYPTYWACLLVTFFSMSLFPISNERSATVSEFLMNTTMLQGLLKIKNVDGAYWSLLPELLFYGFILVLYQTKQLKNIKIFGAIWLILVVIAKTIQLPGLAVILLNLNYGMLFFAGILFYKIWQGEQTWQNHALIAACFITALYYFNDKPEALWIMPIIFLVFYLFTFGLLKWMVVKTFNFFRKYIVCVIFSSSKYRIYRT